MKEQVYYLKDNCFPYHYKPLKIRQKCGGADSYFYKLIHNILVEDDNITSYFSSGVTKIVYNTINKNKLFKMVVVKSRINLSLKEPLYMLTNNDICNKPSNITVYISKESEKNLTYHNNLHIINIENDYCLITWFEEKALSTGRDISDPLAVLKLDSFLNKTRSKIKKDGFCDLSLNNMGIFEFSPIYRWIDIRPIAKLNV